MIDLHHGDALDVFRSVRGLAAIVADLPGGTGLAALVEGHDFTGCDVDPGCVDIARARLAFWTPERHRLERDRGAAVRDAAKAREEAEARGQTSLFGGEP